MGQLLVLKIKLLSPEDVHGIAGGAVALVVICIYVTTFPSGFVQSVTDRAMVQKSSVHSILVTCYSD